MKKMAEVLSCNADGTANVALYKHEKCSGCGTCNKNVHPGSVIIAENPVNAGEGDMVAVELHKHFSFKPIIIKYILPLVMFFGGLGLGVLFFPEDEGGWQAVLLGFVLLIVSLIVAFVFQSRYRPKYTAKIIKRA